MNKRSLIDILLLTIARSRARRMLSRFMACVQNCPAAQKEILLGRIRANQDTAYGRDHGFGSIGTYEDFARRVPISQYENLSPYIEQVKLGNTSAMFGPGQRVLMFALTSGTTDKPKYIPVTDQFLADYRRGWNAFGVKALMDHEGTFLRPIVQVTSPMDDEHTAAGVPCGAITGILAATQQRLVRRYYVTPPCVAYITDSASRYYTIMRLALAGDVGFMITASPATQLRLARAGDENAEQIIRDLRDGTLCGDVDVPEEIRQTLSRRLRARPQRAKQLSAIAERTGRLLPKDAWRMGFMANWTGGTMGLYLKDFPEYFGDTPVRDIGLLASEGRMSIPVEDGTAAGILEVSSHFYEFIPVGEKESSQPVVLRAHELEIGQEYFILLTTAAGFYRYDIGDQIRVVGFASQTPIIEFLHRGAHVCSLTGEKLTEEQAVQAFHRTREKLKLAASRFVLAPQWDTTPYYLLHIESRAVSHAQAAPLIEGMERELRRTNIEYACKQDSGRLGRLRLNLLPAGFLADLETQLSHQNRSRQEQYKHKYLYHQPAQDADFPINRIEVAKTQEQPATR